MLQVIYDVTYAAQQLRFGFVPYADVLRCYDMATFVDVRLARLTSHADSNIADKNVKSPGASLLLI